jgi:serine protease DegS
MRDIMGGLTSPATFPGTCLMLKALRFFGWPLLAGVLIALLIIQRYPEWVGLPSVNLQQAPQTTIVQQGPVSYADAVGIAAPSVVNLYTTKVINKPAHPLFEDPQFRRFFGDNSPKQKRMESSLGSGVIMSPEGYILTNNHVTSGADQIVVALKDGRETLARVIGSDPETDLAVLKIDLKNLPAITVGRSDSIRIGDVALAIGNPFGVGQTVTMGIISATGRNQLGLNNYEDFIQTDAAINPGNSGGALVDANGNLTGINTAIFSKSGGSQGIGFAIPVKLAMEVMKSIIEHGQVIRGWLGIEVQPLTQELAESFGLSGRPGIVVAGIFRDGPAQKAGLQLGDVILSIDGEPAGDGRRSMNQVARIKPTDKVTIQVMRNGKELKLTAEIGLRPPPAPVKEKEE